MNVELIVIDGLDVLNDELNINGKINVLWADGGFGIIKKVE